jgi:hypothetical protein
MVVLGINVPVEFCFCTPRSTYIQTIRTGRRVTSRNRTCGQGHFRVDTETPRSLTVSRHPRLSRRRPCYLACSCQVTRGSTDPCRTVVT